ncbi:MAG: hypothetical protein ACYDEX_19275 [Mobilitalea sp.]
MKRYRNLIIFIIFILFFGLIFCFFTNTSKLHEQVNVNDVETINIWGTTNRVADSVEKQDITNWFNSTTNVRQNKYFAGTTPEAGINIKLKNGSSIHILKSGTDFEVQRTNSSGKFISYWGKQSNIRNVLLCIIRRPNKK